MPNSRRDEAVPGSTVLGPSRALAAPAPAAVRDPRAWATLLQCIPAAVVLHGPDTAILASNSRAQALLGLTEDQLLGKRVLDPAWHFFRQDGSVMPVAEYPVNQVLATHAPLELIAGVHRPDQSDVWLLVQAEPVTEEHGEIALVVVAFVDVTEQRRNAEELRIREARYRMAEAVGHVGNWEYNLQTTHFWGSDEAKRIYGFDPAAADFSTDEVEACIPERARVHQALVDLIEADKRYDLEFEIHPRDGSAPRVASSIAELRRDGRGQPLMVVGVIRDVTARKRAEEALVELNRDLERRVADRTTQLASAIQDMESFVYSVSHDLRAPARHVESFLALLRERMAAALDEQSERYMGAISAAAHRMGTLIDDLISFSRQARHELSWSKVDLSHLVREVVRALEPEARGRSVDWRLASLPVVDADAGMLRDVFDHLLRNALKFTRPRQEAVIEVGAAPNGEREAVVYVRDNGVGFDARYAHKLFGVFQRLHAAEAFEGTGIGLATVRRIVGRHGGRVWAEGEIGRGATFYVALPRAAR